MCQPHFECLFCLYPPVTAVANSVSEIFQNIRSFVRKKNTSRCHRCSLDHVACASWPRTALFRCWKFSWLHNGNDYVSVMSVPSLGRPDRSGNICLCGSKTGMVIFLCWNSCHFLDLWCCNPRNIITTEFRFD